MTNRVASISLACLALALALAGPATGGSDGLGVRAPAVAGRFYDADPARLAAGIAALLDDAVPQRPGRPVGLLAPHAGYVFSGQTAADAWRQVQGRDIEVVVILGTNHTVAPWRGASVYDGPGYRTPLGTAPVARDLAAALLAADDDLMTVRPTCHRREHSVEVQVPFVQTVLPRARILPLIVGTHHPDTCRRLGELLARVLGDRRAVIVASSDLSHYPDASTAVEVDTAVLAAAATLDPDRIIRTIADLEARVLPGLDTCACGEGALLVMLHAARGLGANHAVVLDRVHSGETALGESGRVVGYGALLVSRSDTPGRDTEALAAPAPAQADRPLDRAEQAALLTLARRTVEQFLDTGTAPLARGHGPRLSARQGAFVTLTDARGHLRGCIGHMAEDRPLAEVVGAMAIQAAIGDRRFTPVGAREMPSLHLEISVLTPARRVAGPETVRVGVDGVIMRLEGRQAVFLPQVATEQGWDRDTLLTRLSRKAGLPGLAWRRPECALLTFQAQVFGED